MQEDGDSEGLVGLHNASRNPETAHHAHRMPMTALCPTESTYLFLASKEAPPHVANHSTISFFPSLTMVVPIRQVIVSTRHFERQ
jgi:hypothetical protein